jgi:uncharacterized membrane protein YqhA
VIEDADHFNSWRVKRTLISFVLFLIGATLSLLVPTHIYKLYKLVIKNVDDLNSPQENTEMIPVIGYVGGILGVGTYMARAASLEICDMMVVKDVAGFNSLKQKICLMIVRFLGTAPMASYLILCLLGVYSMVTKNSDGFYSLNSFIHKMFDMLYLFGISCGIPLTLIDYYTTRI